MLERVSPELRDATAATFRRLGPRDFSLAAVAEAAGVSPESVTDALGTRDGAIKLALDHMSVEYFQTLTQVIEQQPTLADQVGEVCVEFTAHRQRSDQRHTPALTSSQLVQLFSTYGDELMLRSVEFWTPRVRAAQATGEVRADVDPARAAEWIVRIATSFELMPQLDVNLEDPDAVRWFVSRFVVRGLGG